MLETTVNDVVVERMHALSKWNEFVGVAFSLFLAIW